MNHLLGRLDGLGVTALAMLKAADLYEHFTKPGLKVCSLPSTRRFLGYLHDEGVIPADLSVCVPKIRIPRPLPSIYTRDEISRVLAAVDRSTAIGRRDYAILMLASKLGLRSSDITNLSIGNIDRESATISIIQKKTSRPLKLVLNPDVKETLDAYIDDGRPASSSDKVFLRHKAPFEPLRAGTCFEVAFRYFEEANIAPSGRRRGPHALRASYATSLINKGVPYSVVKEALGHDDPESIKHYARVDIRRLRTCALDVPMPTGSFAIMIGDLEGRL